MRSLLRLLLAAFARFELSPLSLPPGVHVVEGGQTSTGSIVAWLRRELLGAGASYEQLNEEAAGVPPGCEGLTCLDHFQVCFVVCTCMGSIGDAVCVVCTSQGVTISQPISQSVLRACLCMHSVRPRDLCMLTAAACLYACARSSRTRHNAPTPNRSPGQPHAAHRPAVPGGPGGPDPEARPWSHFQGPYGIGGVWH